MATIWPRYDGSVRISWYPVIDVLKQTSPLAVSGAPKDWPRQTLPSSRARRAELMALQYRGNRAKLKKLCGKFQSSGDWLTIAFVTPLMTIANDFIVRLEVKLADRLQHLGA